MEDDVGQRTSETRVDGQYCVNSFRQIRSIRCQGGNKCIDSIRHCSGSSRAMWKMEFSLARIRGRERFKAIRRKIVPFNKCK